MLASTRILSATEQANLNNVRAILKRQLRPLSGTDAVTVANLLAVYSNMMRAAGLAKELMEYLQDAMNALEEDSPAFNTMQLELAKTMDTLGGYEYEAGALYQELIDTYMRQDVTTAGIERGKAQIAYANHLRGRGNIADALIHLQQAAELLRTQGDAATSANALHQLALLRVAKGDIDLAIGHFEQALENLQDDQFEMLRAQIIMDLVSALLQKGKIARVEALLEIADSVLQRTVSPLLLAKLNRHRAYVHQMRARAATEAQEKQSHFEQATTYLFAAIESLLTINENSELATTYHDLGRLEAQRKQYDSAEAHIRKSAELFSRLNDRRSFAVAQITLGQLILVKNRDAEGAVDRIRQALSIAAELQDAHTLTQAAQSLVRIHHMQTQRALKLDQDMQKRVLRYIEASVQRLQAVGEADLNTEIQKLQENIQQLS